MAKILEFPAPKSTGDTPDYTGRMLTLNPEKALKFQCGGFVLGPKHMCDVVGPRAQMAQIRRALEAEILIDITDADKGIKTKYSTLSGVEKSDTGQKAYVGPKQMFRDLGLAAFQDISEKDLELDELVCVMTDDVEEQQRIEAKIKESKPLLVLPPGMDNPDKYMLKL